MVPSSHSNIYTISLLYSKIGAKWLGSENIVHIDGNGRPYASLETFEEVSQLFKINPSLPISTATMQSGLPRSTFHRIIRESFFLFRTGFKIFKTSLRWIKNTAGIYGALFMLLRRISEYWPRIVFADEWMFKMNSFVNKQNVWIWSNECQMEHNPTVLSRPGAIMWCALSNERVTAPYLSSTTMLLGKHTV